MKTTLLLGLMLSVGIFFCSVQPTTAESLNDRTDVNFIHAIMKKNEQVALSYLDGAKLPLIKEKKPICGYSIVPSQKKDVHVLVAYVREQGK